MGGVVRVCGAADIDQIVTEAEIPPTTSTTVEEAGIEVTIG